MTFHFKSYPSTKDSGVPWLGAVPQHWELRRLRNVCEMRVSTVDKHAIEGELPVRLCNYVDVYKNDHIRANMNFMRATATQEEIERFRLAGGDVLITKDSETWKDIGVPAVVREAADDIVSGYHLALLRPSESRITGEFLFRALQTTGVQYQFHIEANGVTRYGLSHSAIKSVWIPVPPLSEQAAIVRFLDHADRRIRRYIRAKQNQIKLLEEQKQAIIHRAVTRGLDPSVRLRPSGVECLGDVPEHWEIRRLKSIVVRVDQGVSPQAENYLAEGDAWGVLKAGCVNRGVFREKEHKRLPAGFKFDSSLAVAVGDVLVSRASGSPHLVGSAGRVSSLTFKLILSDKTFRPVFVRSVDPHFMVLVMNGRYYREQVVQAISGAEGLANNLPLSSLRAFHFALPSIGEQHAIVRYLRETVDDHLAMIDIIEREVAVLREYRTRLIADVVTGTVDVREAAARLPEGAGDTEPLDEPDAEMDREESADQVEAVAEEAGV
jgi:type I restriction enzyme S subunit